MDDLRGKIALVTGSAINIGYAIATTLAAAGAAVECNDVDARVPSVLRTRFVQAAAELSPRWATSSMRMRSSAPSNLNAIRKSLASEA